jgi:SAM-dependent methyltransferase
VGLAIATRAAEGEGLHIRTIVRDLEEQGLPAGSWDVVTVVHFLHRPLLTGLAGIVTPGGILLYAHPTRRNLERHPRPPARFLLEEGELPLRLPGFEIVHCEEGWLDEDRHEVRLIARRI